MSGNQEITWTLDFPAGRQRGQEHKMLRSDRSVPDPAAATETIPRTARLLALAIRFEGLLRTETIRDYSELAGLGRVTRARMTQIMKLSGLAPDIQEQILFLPPIPGFNERNLRPLVRLIDWNEQRRQFQQIMDRLRANASAGEPPFAGG